MKKANLWNRNESVQSTSLDPKLEVLYIYVCVVWSVCQSLASVMAKTVELHTIWETIRSKFGLDTGCATRIFGFIFFFSSREVPVGLHDGRNEIRRETFISTPFPFCYSQIIPPFARTAYESKFNLVYC